MTTTKIAANRQVRRICKRKGHVEKANEYGRKWCGRCGKELSNVRPTY